MTDLRKAAEMALDALHNIDQSNNYDAIEALRQALAQPEQDYERGFIDGMQKQMQSTVEKAVNAMTNREWVGLTDEEMKKTWYETKNIMGWYSFEEIARLVEAKLKEKNT